MNNCELLKNIDELLKIVSNIRVGFNLFKLFRKRKCIKRLNDMQREILMSGQDNFSLGQRWYLSDLSTSIILKKF